MGDSEQQNQKPDNQTDNGQAGDQVGGDKTTVGDIKDSIVAIGPRAQATVNNINYYLRNDPIIALVILTNVFVGLFVLSKLIPRAEQPVIVRKVEEPIKIILLTDTPPPTDEPTPTSESTPLANPTPLRVDEPIYFSSLESQTDGSWRVWQDSDGRAGYENGGYYVLAFDSKAGWLSANLDDEYRNFVLNIDAIPISHSLITGYAIAVGWDESNSYYSFEVQPDGECGMIIVKNYQRTPLLFSRCPQPVQNELIHIHLEVEEQNMRAFINDEYITTMYLPDYQYGKIGLGTYNGGRSGSGAEAKMQFNNLAIWDLPITTNYPNYGND